MLWEAVLTKKVTLPGNAIMELSPDDWWENVQFIYKQIDGPPKTVLEHTGADGGPIKTEDVTPITDLERAERITAILERARQARDRQTTPPADLDGE